MSLSLKKAVEDRLQEVQDQLSDREDVLRQTDIELDDYEEADNQAMILEGRVQELLWFKNQLEQGK
ncbi:hypothetical protein [Fictibacillus sp. NRS-1165]|uniref:hypothetical protein n=1 Tax=Fictibacillus sp. NRS-1165 TaxID=3144463 RepID=UPI003D1F67B3